MTPRMMRYTRRGAVVLGGAAGLFSFVMVDLARNDAVFSTRLEIYPTPRQRWLSPCPTPPTRQ